MQVPYPLHYSCLNPEANLKKMVFQRCSGMLYCARRRRLLQTLVHISFHAPLMLCLVCKILALPICKRYLQCIYYICLCCHLFDSIQCVYRKGRPCQRFACSQATERQVRILLSTTSKLLCRPLLSPVNYECTRAMHDPCSANIILSLSGWLHPQNLHTDCRGDRPHQRLHCTAVLQSGT